MLSALILVCSLAITPNIRDCDQANAVDVIRLRSATASPTSCLLQGEAYVAGTAIGRNIAVDEALKVTCARRSDRAYARTLRKTP